MISYSKHILKKQILQKSYFYLIISIFCCTILLVSSCGKNYQAHLIPKNTELVAKVNTEQIFFKLNNWEQMLNETFEKYKTKNPYDIEISQQLWNSGINFINIYFFGNFTDNHNNYFGFIFALNNRRQFQDFLEENNLRNEIRKKHKIYYIEMFQSVLAWNNKTLLFLGAKSNEKIEELTQKAKEILNSSPKQTLYHHNKNFQEFIKVKSDFSLWCNVSDILQSTIQKGTLASKIDLEGQFLNTFTRFRKGDLKTDIKYFLPLFKNNKFKNLLQDNINQNLLKSSYRSKPIAVGGISLNMSLLKEILEKEKIDIKMDSIVGRLGFTADEVFGMLDGDFVLILQDMIEVTKNIEKRREEDNKLYYEQKKVKQPQIALGFSINKRKTFEKLKKMGLKSNLMLKEEGFYSVFSEFFLIEKDSTVFITLSKVARDQIIKSSDISELNNALAQKGNDKSLSLFVRKKFLDIFHKENKLFSPADLPIDYLSFYQGGFKDQWESNGELLIEFIEQDKNSLEILYNAFKNILQKLLSRQD